MVSGTFTQLFPPAPTFTENNLGDLSGKVCQLLAASWCLFLTLSIQVYIITGAASGVGLELAKLLYAKNGSVYVAARSQKRAQGGIDAIKKSVPNSRGSLGSVVVDLADLSTIKPAVEKFVDQQSRLDALFLNAGIMTPPPGSKTSQGHDLELGVHCLAGFLLVRLLEPTLIA